MLSGSWSSPHLEAGEEHHVFPLNQLLQRSEVKGHTRNRFKAETKPVLSSKQTESAEPDEPSRVGNTG